MQGVISPKETEKVAGSVEDWGDYLLSIQFAFEPICYFRFQPRKSNMDATLW